jgi:hypothetical protein
VQLTGNKADIQLNVKSINLTDFEETLSKDKDELQ